MSIQSPNEDRNEAISIKYVSECVTTLPAKNILTIEFGERSDTEVSGGYLKFDTDSRQGSLHHTPKLGIRSHRPWQRGEAD